MRQLTPVVINERLIRAQRRRRCVRGFLNMLIAFVVLAGLGMSGALFISESQARLVAEQTAVVIQSTRDQIARQQQATENAILSLTAQHQTAVAPATAQRQTAIAQATEQHRATMLAALSTINLSAGGRWQIASTSGGALPAARLSAGCVGFIKELPDLKLNFSGNASELTLYFIAANADTTLAVQAPDGAIFCDDDSYGNANPQVTINNPVQGVYQIWIGSYEAGRSHRGTLYITSQVAQLAAISQQIPPHNQRTRAPRGAVRLNNGSGLTNGARMSDGEFQVEGYCRPGERVRNTNTDWFCGDRRLQVADFDEICRRTYNNRAAFAILDGSSAIPAYRWRCYAFR
ncbi:MAG: hypothetical protein RML95_12150 [Anaerolineae bacterium]|nr:hypothetical protein [Anaerolineae bacterium]